MARRNSGEARVIGFNAVRAVLARRPADVLRLYVEDALVERLAVELRQLAALRRPYHVVEKEDLDRLTKSLHHEGLAAIVRARRSGRIADLGQGPSCVLVLDGVANPHNVGAIVRSAAHFGATAVVTFGEATERSAELRVAEGGAEYVDRVSFTSHREAFDELRRAAFTILATSAGARAGLWDRRLPARAALVLGSEGAGSREEVISEADGVICIPGTGWVESLNVSNAAAVLLAEWWRTHGRR